MSKFFMDEYHAQNVLQRMWEQSERNEFCDVSLIPGETEGMKISAHRSVLSASSEYFESMFKPPFNESSAKEVKLDGVDGGTLKSLIKFCYLGQLEMTVETVEKLLITADSLLLGAVVYACGGFLAEQLHPNNCLGMSQLAERYHCDLLFKQAKAFCMEYFVEVYKSDEFSNLSVVQLAQLLASDDLLDPTEEHVFKSIMIWLEHDPSERKQHKDEMLKLVRMSLLTPSFLVEHVLPVCTSPASLQLCSEATDWHLMPDDKRVNASGSSKPRRSGERLIAITEETKLNILYHCPHRFKWITLMENLEHREDFGVAVMNDDLFIVGGIVGINSVNTIICINLKTMILKNINPMSECRHALGVAAINGVLYVVGGWSADPSSVEKWDSTSNIWSMVASMSVGRCSFGITVFNAKIYVAGGVSGGTFVKSAECYNPQENVWSSIASMCQERCYLALEVANGMLYAVGGLEKRTIERYDHETNQWSMICRFSAGICNEICTTFNGNVIALYDDYVEQYSSAKNECQENTSITGLSNVKHTFSFSGSLLDSKFF